MCGIAGFVSTTSGPHLETVLKRMTGCIRHRGPDASGYHFAPPAYLGHRRLSIIDLATGQQPMTNEDGSLWIVYNGEIFNHADVRPELEKAGHRYRTRCDTETILHAYEQYGADCLSQFRGMFSFAIWDSPNRTLFCARDRLGIKPFYYFWDGHVFAFASEIKALLQHPAISANFDSALLPEYLAFGYISSDLTLFSNIRKLMPGHFLKLELDTPKSVLTIVRYWDVPAALEPEEREEQDWIRECRARLEETVSMRLMSDVPLGMFLSGGVDSSAMAALMKRMVSTPVETFSVGYREQLFSELHFARQVADAIGTHHQEIVIGADDFFAVLPKLIWHEDEPITWPSSVSLYFVSKLASERVKVVLTGEGSDELFGGYSRYHFYAWNQQWLNAWNILPDSMRRGTRRLVANCRLLSSSLRRKLQHTFIGRGDDLNSLYLDNFYCAFSADQQSRLLSSENGLDPYRNFLACWEARAGAPALSRMLYADQKTYLVELLMKQDQMSMANSIESRVPFLDHLLVEFAARVPADLKIRNGVGKYIFKRAVEDVLPRSIIYRKKMGFPTPIRQWLSEPSAHELVTGLAHPSGFLASYLDRSEVERVIQRHRSGIEDATDRLWRLINLQLWGAIFCGGAVPSRWEESVVDVTAGHRI